jgi:hypothetical protein
MSGPLDEFIAAGPWPQRAALRGLLALGRRPRGARLLGLVPQAGQLAASLLGFGRYEDPTRARELGYDAAAVVQRGREARTR